MNYGIGTKFIRRGTKRKDVETVVDIRDVHSRALGMRIFKQLVAEHYFLGQRVQDVIVPTTIDMGKLIEYVPEQPGYSNFMMDKEKVYDFFRLSKEEFLKSYHYLTEEEYNKTKEIIDYVIEQSNSVRERTPQTVSESESD